MPEITLPPYCTRCGRNVFQHGYTTSMRRVIVCVHCNASWVLTGKGEYERLQQPYKEYKPSHYHNSKRKRLYVNAHNDRYNPQYNRSD